MKKYPCMLSGSFLRKLPEELKKRERIRGIVCVLLVVLLNFTVYYIPKLAAGLLVYFPFSSCIDDRIPVLPVFASVYLLAYFQWGFYWIRMMFDEESVRYRFMSGEILAKLVCLICFLAIPVTMERPVLEGTDFFSGLVRYIYQVDTPTCLFPSIHCFQSWMAIRYLWVTRGKRPYTWFAAIFSILVILSTLLIKQHLLMDAVAGVLLAEVVLWLADRIHLSSLLKKGMEWILPDRS